MLFKIRVCIDRGALFAIDGVRFHQAFGELKSRRTMLEHRLCDLDPGLCFVVGPSRLSKGKGAICIGY